MDKYEQFCLALQNLKDIYDYEEPYTNVILTGLVALFEICYEKAWKAVKEKLLENGAGKGMIESPKAILKTAYQMGMIQGEEIWIRALKARNYVAHDYNPMYALEIIRETKAEYYDMFCDLKSEIEKNWR